jgi:transcriptional regulator with XRE-family HTH domain
MTPSAPNPARARYRLRTRIRGARLDAGLTQQQVADELNAHASKVIRIENGDVAVKAAELKTLLAYLKIEEQYDELVDLAVQSRYLPWDAHSAVLSPETRKFFGLEASAQTIRDYTTQWVPGLLQTPEYTRALLKGTFGLSPDAVESHLQVRIQRQELLYPGPDAPNAHFIVSEAALRCEVGGRKILDQQIHHLHDMLERPKVTVKVLPFSSGATFGLRGPFTHLQIGGDPDIVYLESKSGKDTFANDPEQADLFRDQFLALEKVSVDLAKWRP